MPISVTVKDLQAGGPAREVELPEPVATIGRATACSLVLQDMERHVSRLHATIALRDDGHYLLNNSRVNPVLVDGLPCEPESATALRDGTVILMHPFELTLHVRRGAAPEAGDHGWLGELHAKAADADPFNLDVQASQAAPAPPQIDIFLRQERPASPRLVEDIENPPDAAPPSLDPLDLLNRQEANTGQAQLSTLLNSAGSGQGQPLVEFWSHNGKWESTPGDHVQAINLKFTPPTVLPPEVVESSADSHEWPLDWPFDTPAGPPPPETHPGEPPVPTGPSSTGTLDAGAIQSFLRGLGVSFDVPAGQEAAFFENAGAIMKVTVQGLVDLLVARGEVKRELRVEDRTMLAASANNPLKFVGSSAEALRFLFDPASAPVGTFLPPVKAIEDACGELVAHELGMVAGTRAAVIGAIRRFDPQALAQGAGSPRGGLALWRKARLWEMYAEHYAQVQADMADNLDSLFERDFLEAYTEQVRRVARK